jgi:hypothetical protein
MPIRTSKAAHAQVAQDLDPFNGVDVGVHVADADALFVHVFGQVLGHLLGQDGDQGAVAGAGDGFDLVDDVVDLVAGRGGDGADLDGWVDQAGGADDLFDEDAAGRSISQGPGVAETKTVWGRMASHSSNFSGRLSMQLGRRKPYSARVDLRR